MTIRPPNMIEVSLVLRGAGYAAAPQMTMDQLTEQVRWPNPKRPGQFAGGKWINKVIGTESTSLSIHPPDSPKVWQRMTPHEAGYTDEDGNDLVTGQPIRPDRSQENARLRSFLDLVRSRGVDLPMEANQGNLITGQPAITDTDFQVLGALRALHDAGITVEEFNTRGGVIAIRTCTPDTPHLSNEGGDFAERMGFDPSKVKIVVKHLGCAGVGDGLSEMMAWMKMLDRPLGMVVGSNCASGSGMDPATLRASLQHPHPVAPAACIFFSDGGGAMVFEQLDDAPEAFAFETSYPVKLVDFPVGGSACQVTEETVGGAHYLMEAKEVGQLFVPMIAMNAEFITSQLGLGRGWPEIQAVLMHQANFRLVAQAAQLIGVLDRTPMTNDLANTVNASVPIVTARAIKQGLLRSGGRAAVLTVGAGHGAQLAGGSVVYLPR